MAKRTGLGITPAYAGKSGPPPSLFALSRDHPRVCGEKISRKGGEKMKRGSPPRMRGKVLLYADSLS